MPVDNEVVCEAEAATGALWWKLKRTMKFTPAEAYSRFAVSVVIP
jgi:hypothetical protein